MVNIESPADAVDFRVQRIKYGIATSIAGKIVATAVQMLAMPIAIRALGPEQFALYALLAATLSWVGLANIGIGPGLILGIASARADGDRSKESQLISSAFLPVLLFVVLLGLVLGAIILGGPVATTFGANYAQYVTTIRLGLELLLAFTLLQSLIAVVEAVQTAYQAQYVFNLWTAVGGGVTLVALILTAKFRPAVITLILAVNLPPLIFRLINAVRFVSFHPHLIPRLHFFDRSDSKALLINGLAYSLVGIGSFLNHQFPLILVGRTLEPHAAATFAAIMNAFLLGFGLVTMVTGPMLPAIADSMARGEVMWAHRAYLKLLGSAMAYACVVGITFAIAGRWVFRIWFGPNINPSGALVAFLGLYFVLAMWEYIHYIVLMGLKQIRVPSAIYLVRSLLALALVTVFIPKWGENGAMIGLIVSVVATTSWLFPHLTRLTIGTARRVVLDQGTSEVGSV